MRLPHQIKMLRRFRNNFLPLLLIFAAQKSCAQYMTANDFFNSGAQLYISNNIPEALKRTESGLRVFPNDEKLKKLEQLLKQQQQSQSQQNQQQQQNQQNQSRQNQNQQKQNSQQSQNQQQQKQNQQNEKQNPQQQQAQQKPGEEKKNQENAQAMSPQEAKQLLDSQKNNEQFLSPNPKGKPQNSNHPVKDW